MHLFYHGLMNLFCTPEGLSTLEVKSITDYISPVNLEVGRMMSIRSIDSQTVNTKHLFCNGIGKKVGYMLVIKGSAKNMNPL